MGTSTNILLDKYVYTQVLSGSGTFSATCTLEYCVATTTPSPNFTGHNYAARSPAITWGLLAGEKLYAKGCGTMCVTLEA